MKYTTIIKLYTNENIINSIILHTEPLWFLTESQKNDVLIFVFTLNLSQTRARSNRQRVQMWYFFFLAFITLLTGNGMRGGQHAAKCHRLDSNSGLLQRRQGLCSWDVCWTTRTMILLLQKVHFLSSTLPLRLQSSYLPAKWLNGLLSHTPSMSGLTAVCSFRGKIMTQTRFSLKINKLYSNKVNFTWSKTFIFFQ